MEFNPSRLTLARRRRGLTQRALAEAVGCADRTVRRWESGDVPPELKHINALTRVLGFPSRFFFMPDAGSVPADAVSFRSLARARASDRDRFISAGELALELNDWIERQFDLPTPDVPDLRHNRDNPEAAANALRTRWGLGDGPIPNLVALLESKGVRVFSLAEQQHEIDAYSFWQGETPFIMLNTFKSGEKSRFDAAHELAHLVLHPHGSATGRPEEKEANLFAGAFLMPASSITEYAPRIATIDRLIEAKHIWNVSLAALVYRLHQLGIVSDWQHFALLRDMQRRGFRTSEPESGPREMSQVLDKVLKALRAEGVGKTEIAAQLGWSLDDLNALVFGLVLSPIKGDARVSTPPQTEVREQLRLLK